MDCIFCKIAKGEAPCKKVYEDDKLIAFLDIAPVNHGHILVIPKEHYTNFFEAPDEVLADLIKASKKISKAMCQALGIDSFYLRINTNKAAGQSVNHLHVHLIPRFLNDGLSFWPTREYVEGEIDVCMKKIKKEIDKNS